MAVKLEFKDITEAWRVRRIVEMWNPANDDLIPWRDELVKRLGVQLDVLEREDKYMRIINDAKDENNVIAPDPKTALYQILETTNKLCKVLEQNLGKCGDFSKMMESDKFDCHNCGDTRVCELLRILLGKYKKYEG